LSPQICQGAIYENFYGIDNLDSRAILGVMLRRHILPLVAIPYLSLAFLLAAYVPWTYRLGAVYRVSKGYAWLWHGPLNWMGRNAYPDFHVILLEQFALLMCALAGYFAATFLYDLFS